jgi:hypothetical protein
LRIDEDGNLLWENNYGQHSWNEAQEIIEIADEGYIIVGKSSSDFGEAYILKIDRDGHTVWERLYIDRENNGFKGVVQLDVDDYLAAGYTYLERGGPAEIYLVRFDDNGNTTWQTTMPNHFSSMVYTPEGGILLSVDIRLESGWRDVSITKIELGE